MRTLLSKLNQLIKSEPTAVSANSKSQVTQSNDAEKLFNSYFFLWTFLRKQHAFDQIVPIIFKGWMMQIRNVQQNTIQKTTETFLPPITLKVTDFHTIQKYLSYLQNLARSVNMSYVLPDKNSYLQWCESLVVLRFFA